MLSINDLDQVAPLQAKKVRQIANECAIAWGWPYYAALDCVLIDIDRRMENKMAAHLDSPAPAGKACPRHI